MMSDDENQEDPVFQEMNQNSSLTVRKASRTFTPGEVRRAEFEGLRTDFNKLSAAHQATKQELTHLREKTSQHASKVDLELGIAADLSKRIGNAEDRAKDDRDVFNDLRANAPSKSQFETLEAELQQLRFDHMPRIQFLESQVKDLMTDKLDGSMSLEEAEGPTMQSFRTLDDKVEQIGATVFALQEDVKEISKKASGEVDVPKANANEVAVYVKLICRTSDHTKVEGGQDTFLLKLDWTYGDVVSNLKRKIRNIQDKDKPGRANFSNLNAYWSQEHEVDSINVFLEPTSSWGNSFEADGNGVIMDSDNCTANLILLQRAPALPTLYVTIKPCEMDKEMNEAKENWRAQKYDKKYENCNK